MSFNYEDITGNISSLGTHTEQPQEKDKLFLPPEVWGLICSQLRVISMPSLLNLSLVSTTLYTEALAHLYYEITIPDRKDLDLSILYGVNSTYVRKYTKSLVISSSVRSSIMTQISKLIPECLVLESIRLYIPDMEIANDPNNWGTVSYKTLPSYLQEALELQSAGNLPKTQLHLQARSGVHDVVLVPETFSPEMLTSFHCHIHGKAMGVWSARAIGRFLAKAVNLKSLDLVVNRQDMSPSERWLLLISRDENENRRLPAIEKLRLVQYDWSQHPDYFPRLWDFSNLKSLELRGVQIENFLSGVPFEMLSGLEELSITDRVYSIPIRPAGSTVPDFKSELWPHLKKLQSLEIGMWWSRYLDLKTLVLFPRLRKLNLSLFGLYRKPYAHQPILSLEDLEFVLATLPELRVLGLAMDIQVNLEQANEFLAGICKFRDLISLRLDISMGSETTFVRTEDSYLLFPPPRSRDDDVYGHKIIQYLVTCKQGVAFEEIMVVDRHGADRIPFYRYEKERGESLRFKAGIGGYDNRDVQASVPTANVNGIEEKVVIEGRSEVSAGIS